MKRSQLKYYLKQMAKPVSLVAVTIGFVGVLIGAAGLLLAVRYGRLLTELQQQSVELQNQTNSSESTKNDQGELLPLKYQVKAGDSSWQLAAIFYGDGDLYPIIEKANNLPSDAWLVVGTELVIPKIDSSLEKQANSEKSVNSSTIISSDSYRIESISDSSASSEKREKYIVQAGDSLWFISLKYLDNAYLWPELYRLNQKVVGKNPDLIYPGTELVLPIVKQ